ncbi:MAG: sodium:calcium antiporter [Chloroflexia bacterium]
MNKWIPVLLAILVGVPGVLLRLGVYHFDAPLRALTFGIAIIGSAFLLSWTAEALQIDVSQGVALALLALIAILPEYIVDASFAWLAASNPEYAGYAVANMTGANRLLIGIAWPLVIAILWFRTRQHSITFARTLSLEIVVLLAASLYAFIIPFKGTLSIMDLVILVSLFLVYVVLLSRLPTEEPHLVGPARLIGALPAPRRRLTIGVLAFLAAGIILLVAHDFATSLVEAGTELGFDEFLLVQWLAPLASEAPEFVVVSIFAWRAAASAALGALVSSKINQWTLLVAMLPLVYSIASGEVKSLVLDERQQGEILLTAGQSIFAVVLLLDMSLAITGAGILFVLFIAQFFFSDANVEFTIIYFVLAIITLLISRGKSLRAFRGARETTLEGRD